ncbi:MAG: outer membrane protein assembly factor BamD [Acidobacteriota bacterium]|nr:outer membrane protein assembly factor BamD [Acidobacteriota bacterium]
MQQRYKTVFITAALFALFVPSGYGWPFRHKKYEAPITKDTLQPDKILFDRAIKNIEHGEYEAARLTLNTLINTYDTSEYLAKAKLAIADSWFREGGTHGLGQAEAEYKDFILFYPNLEEAAESQFKICNIHYKQMEKADRDNAQGQMAEDECRQVMEKFPNSKFLPQAQQMLRNTQEVLADKEFKTGDFYHHRGSFPAAANRMLYLSSQYPLYSGSDEALWELADAYKHMGDRFENQEADALSKLVSQYPLSSHVDNAKELLTAMKRPVPAADPAAYARMKYEMENRSRPGFVHRTITAFESHPDTFLAAKTGAPQMTSMRPPVPVSVPKVAAGAQGGISDVSATQVVSNTEAIDRTPDARLNTPAAGTVAETASATGKDNGDGEQKASLGSNGQADPVAAKPAAEAPLPTNHPPTKDQLKASKKAQEKAAKQAKKNPAKDKDTTPAAIPTAATTKQ